MELNGLRFVCDGKCSLETHVDEFPIYAAAPDLLEALQSISENLTSKCMSPEAEKGFRMNPDAEAWRVYLSSLILQAGNEARAALSKATGN